MTDWLIDKSALLGIKQSPDADDWAQRTERGLVRISTVTLLEVGFSAKLGRVFRDSLNEPPLSLMQTEYLTPQMEKRAVEVQLLLADRGLHRAPSIADLMNAAIGELVGLSVLHIDKDYELIAEVTGQAVEQLRLS